MRAKDYNVINWKDFLYYDASSPSGLKWGVHRSNNAKMNSNAGCFCKNSNYYRLTFGRVNYVCSRVIWILHNDTIDQDLVIDHLDGDTRNNLIENLRLVSCRTNNQNSIKNKRNKSGVTGVELVEMHGCVYYRACCRQTGTGKLLSKYFSVSKLGYETAFELACDCREAMMASLIAAGENYSERHGT